MREYMSHLEASSLFDGIDRQGMLKLCTCFDAHEKKIKKDEFILRVGDNVRSIYLLISGRMHIINEDFWGNRTIIETMNADTLFGEAYVLSRAEQHLVSVIATEDSVVLEIEPTKLLDACPNKCSCHMTVIKNVARILSTKIVILTCKLGHIIQRTTQEKLRSYFSECALQAQSSSFDITYSRQQLADYLCVERSALSHELSKMRDAGIIQYRKNHFELLKDDYLEI